MTPDAIDDLIESTCSKVNAGRSLSLNHIGLMLDAIKAQRTEIDRLRAKVEAGEELAELLTHEDLQAAIAEWCREIGDGGLSLGVSEALTAYREAEQ